MWSNVRFSFIRNTTCLIGHFVGIVVASIARGPCGEGSIVGEAGRRCARWEEDGELLIGKSCEPHPAATSNNVVKVRTAETRHETCLMGWGSLDGGPRR